MPSKRATRKPVEPVFEVQLSDRQPSQTIIEAIAKAQQEQALAELKKAAMGYSAQQWAVFKKTSISQPDRVIEPPATTTQGVAVVVIVNDDEGTIVKEGKRYYPLALAAKRVQTPRQTLAGWVEAKREFQGDVYNSPTLHRVFLSEDAIARLQNRFVKVPSEEPAGAVILGEARGGQGYILLSDAAKTLHVTPQTVHNWIKDETAPTGQQLDVIRCTASKMLYIRQRDVDELKKIIPRSGLRAGRRPQLATVHS